jgi:hydrogenase assembly chaperone HypC/HupF
MCITLPTKVLSLEGNNARVDIAGHERKIFIPFDNVSPGQWVLVYAGAAIAVIDEKEALEILGYLDRAGNLKS